MSASSRSAKGAPGGAQPGCEVAPGRFADRCDVPRVDRAQGRHPHPVDARDEGADGGRVEPALPGPDLHPGVDPHGSRPELDERFALGRPHHRGHRDAVASHPVLVRRVGGDVGRVDREAGVLDRVVPAIGRQPPDVAEPTGRDRTRQYRVVAEGEALGHLGGLVRIQHATNLGPRAHTQVSDRVRWRLLQRALPEFIHVK